MIYNSKTCIGILIPILSQPKSLIEEHARLDFPDFLSTPVQNFSCNKQKIPPCSFINLLSKKAGRVEFFCNPARLFWSALLLGTTEYSNKKKPQLLQVNAY